MNRPNEKKTVTTSIQVQVSREFAGEILAKIATTCGSPTAINGNSWSWELEENVIAITIVFVKTNALLIYTVTSSTWSEATSILVRYAEFIPPSFFSETIPLERKKPTELENIFSLLSHPKFKEKQCLEEEEEEEPAPS